MHTDHISEAIWKYFRINFFQTNISHLKWEPLHNSMEHKLFIDSAQPLTSSLVTMQSYNSTKNVTDWSSHLWPWQHPRSLVIATNQFATNLHLWWLQCPEACDHHLQFTHLASNSQNQWGGQPGRSQVMVM